MSTEINPSDVGLACTNCWGNSSLPFGAGFPPDRLLVQVTGIEEGPNWTPVFGNPPNGTYELVQDTGCNYDVTISGLVIELSFLATETFMTITLSGVFAFVSQTAPKCSLILEGEASIPLGVFKNGDVVITL